MCSNGKCLYCIPIKPACLVLAITNAVANGLILMWYVLIWGFAFIVFGPLGGPSLKIGGVRFKRNVPDDSDFWLYTVGIWYFFVVPMVALLNLIFSALLCNGICNSRPKQVKAYFWYGVVITVLAAIASVVLLCIDTKYPYSMYSETNGSMGLTWILGCVLHTLYLVMVYQTHKKVVEETTFNRHVRLNEDREFSIEKHLIKV